MPRLLSALTALAIGAAGIGLAAAAPTRLEIATLVSPAGAPDGSYGSAVAIDDDSAVVGWSEIDDEGETLGRITIYAFTPEGWVEQSTFASDTPGDGFGSAVALDGARIAVGAPATCPEPEGDEEVTGERGAVHLFSRSGGIWTANAVLRDRPVCHRFGMTVALDADIIAAGWRAPDDSIAGVSIFERKGDGWKRTRRLTSPRDDAAEDAFGAAGLALQGTTLAVGAPADANRIDSAVYLFTRDGERWVTDQTLRKPGRRISDGFGTSLGLDRGLIVVGDPDGVGAAHVFERIGGRWRHDARLNPDGGNVGDRFGSAVDIEGQIIAIGAPAAGDPGGAGEVHAFRLGGSTWKLFRTFTASDASADDGLGSSVGISDVTVLAGAPSWDSTCGPAAGAAYVFPLEGNSAGSEPDVRCGAAAGMGATVDTTLAVNASGTIVPVTGDVTSQFTGIGGVFVTFRRVTGLSGPVNTMVAASVTCSDADAAECTWSATPPAATGRYSVTAFPQDAFGRHGTPSAATDVTVIGQGAE